MDNSSLAIEGKIEHLFENAGKFIDIFMRVPKNALLITSIFSEM
jgi:hypothetical protein